MDNEDKVINNESNLSAEKSVNDEVDYSIINETQTEIDKKQQTKIKRIKHTKDICSCALMTCIIVVCSWINVPSIVPFTLQTFAIAFASYSLKPSYSILAIVAYLLLGIIGLPVFANFNSGIGILMGATGGFVLGFVPMCLIISLGCKFVKNNVWLRILFGILGLIVCYLFGSVWFMLVYSKGSDVSFLYVLSTCVIPFIVFDIIKVVLAVFLGGKLSKVLQKPLKK